MGQVAVLLVHLQVTRQRSGIASGKGGAADQFLDALPVDRVGRNAHADFQRHLMPIDAQRSFQQPVEPVGHGHGGIELGAFQKQ